MNDLQLRPIELRVKIYKAISSDSAKSAFENGKHVVSVLVDGQLRQIEDIAAETKLIASQIPQLEQHERWRNNLLVHWGKSFRENNAETVELNNAELQRTRRLIEELKTAEQLLQAIVFRHRSQAQPIAAGHGKSARHKLNLSKKDSGDLNRKIVEVVDDYQDKFNLEESLRKAAENSRKHFGKWIKITGVTTLSKATIEGRYKRNRDKND